MKSLKSYSWLEVGDSVVTAMPRNDLILQKETVKNVVNYKMQLYICLIFIIYKRWRCSIFIDTVKRFQILSFSLKTYMFNKKGHTYSEQQQMLCFWNWLHRNFPQFTS